MSCSYCGKELRDAAVFCMYCGTPVGRIAPFGGQPMQARIIDGKAVAAIVCGILSLLTSGGLLILPTIGVIISMKSEPSGIARAGLYLNAIAFVPGAIMWYLVLFG